MNVHQLRIDLATNTKKLGNDLASDLKAECAHIADPAQCGSIVQRHFDGIVIGIYVFIGIFLAVAMAGIAIFTIH